MFLVMSWILVWSSSIPPLLGVCPLASEFSPGQSSCTPDFSSSLVYPIIQVLIGYITPVTLMIGWNMHIVNIAKYHQYRIANALFKMTFSHLNMTANERKRQEQSTALKRFQGFNAVVTLSQLIGTILLFYSPTYIMTLYESFSGHQAPVSVRWVALLLIMCSPVSNGWVYGIKSKTIQMTFVHFARKQIYKNEVSNRKSLFLARHFSVS